MRHRTFAGVLRLLAVFAFVLGATAFFGAAAFLDAAALVDPFGLPAVFLAAELSAGTLLAGFSFWDDSKQHARAAAKEYQNAYLGDSSLLLSSWFRSSFLLSKLCGA